MYKLVLILFVFSFTSSVWSKPLLSTLTTESSVDQVMSEGTELANSITKVLVSPLVFVSSSLNSFTGTLPNAMAATGAFIGSLISAPIQLTSTLASGLASGITGFLVGIPVAIGSGVKALTTTDYYPNDYSITIDLNKENLDDLIVINKTHVIFIDKSALKDTSLSKRSLSKVLLRPLAVMFGFNTAIGGMSSFLVGQGLKAVGDTINYFGDKLIVNGKDVKGAGSTLYTWGTGGYNIPVISSSDDIFSAINVTNKFPQPVNKYLIDLTMPIFLENLKHRYEAEEEEEVADDSDYDQSEDENTASATSSSTSKHFMSKPIVVH